EDANVDVIQQYCEELEKFFLTLNGCVDCEAMRSACLSTVLSRGRRVGYDYRQNGPGSTGLDQSRGRAEQGILVRPEFRRATRRCRADGRLGACRTGLPTGPLPGEADDPFRSPDRVAGEGRGSRTDPDFQSRRPLNGVQCHTTGGCGSSQ